jgi:hypothetical protein
MRVRANVKGVATVTARTKIGRRTVVAARTTRAVSGSGKATSLTLVLSARARATLRTKRRLRLVITVAYSESDRTIRQVVMLRG